MIKKIRLDAKALRALVLDEAKKFSKMKDVDSVSAKEVDADELANTLEKKHDFTMEEAKDAAVAIIEARRLKEEEVKLIQRIKKVRTKRAEIGRKLGSIL